MSNKGVITIDGYLNYPIYVEHSNKINSCSKDKLYYTFFFVFILHTIHYASITLTIKLYENYKN